MRRGVETHLETCLLKNGSQRVRARSLAVGTSYVNGFILVMWMAIVLIQGFGGLQARLISNGTDVFEHRCHVV